MLHRPPVALSATWRTMRILIVKLSSLGDTLHALPTVAELKRQTGAEIHWAVQPEFLGMVELFACVDRVLQIPRKGNLRKRLRALRALRAESYDLVVDLQGLLKSAIVARFARSPRRIGPSFHREGSRIWYTEIAGLRDKSRHAVEECMDVLDLLGYERPMYTSFPLTMPELPEFSPSVPYPRIAIAPRSRWRSKDWPVAHFAALARRLTLDLGAEIHLIGSAADRSTAETLASLADVPTQNHCGEHSLGQTCALLARMDALVSNDSGPMHMAAVVGTPCVVLFGPTLPGRTGPYGPGHRILRLGNCPPCRSKTCRRGEAVCLSQLAPGLVFEAVREVIEITPPIRTRI